MRPPKENFKIETNIMCRCLNCNKKFLAEERIDNTYCPHCKQSGGFAVWYDYTVTEGKNLRKRLEKMSSGDKKDYLDFLIETEELKKSGFL